MTIPHILFFLLSTIGILETAYLIKSRVYKQRPKCIVGSGQCHIVLESKYNKTFGFHNDMLGLLFYLGLTLLTILVIAEANPFDLWHVLSKVLILTGVVLSAYFTFLQWKVIKQWCFWCLMSAFTILSMSIILIGFDLYL